MRRINAAFVVTVLAALMVFLPVVAEANVFQKEFTRPTEPQDPQPPQTPEPSPPTTGTRFQKDFTQPTQPQPPQDPQPQPGLTAQEQQMFNLINQERTSRGLQPLKIDMELVRLARLKSRDMVENNYFSHYSPTYGSFTQMLTNAGVSYRMAGENLAAATSVSQAHSSLMASSGHRANILRSGFTHVGIGIAGGSSYGSIFTQIYISR